MSIVIPNGVTSIGSMAFYSCNGLTSITIPDSVTTFGYDVFKWCSSLTTFIASAEMKAFLAQNSGPLGISRLIVPTGDSVTTQQLIDLLQGSFTNSLFNSVTGAASTNEAFVSAIANQFTAPGSIYGIASLSYLTNPLYLGTVASNTAFVGSLTAQIVSTPGNYGLATKADLSNPAVLASMATNATFLNALASNPVFLNALTRQISAGSTTNGIMTQSSSAGATFAASLATNASFLNALTEQISTSTSNFGIYVKQPQSLSFPAIAPSTFGSTKAIKLSAVSSKSLSPVTFTSANPSVATISNGNLSVVGAGSTTITASQAGSLSVAPVSVSQPFVVFQLPQTLKFPAIPAQTYVSGKTLTLSTTSSAKLTPVYTSSNEGVATVSNNILTLVGPGTTIITATQQGDANIAPAAPVFQMLTVK
jgi:hypothetical protein